MKSVAVNSRKKRSKIISSKNLKKILWGLFRTALIFAICFIILYPLFLRVVLSFRDVVDVHDPSVIWVTRNFTLHNYELALMFMNFWDALRGTFILSAVITILQILVCAIAGYSFARLKFKGQGIIFALVIFTIVVPPQTTIISRYMTFLNFGPGSGVNILNTYWPFFISAATGMGIKSGLFIYLYRQFFRSMPKELEEAAMVDGAGVVKTFIRIIIPNATPMIITVALFSFVWQWNDMYYATLFAPTMDFLSINVVALGAGVNWRIAGEYVDSNQVALFVNAGMMLTITPLIVMYLFMQKFFVEGIERSGIVG